MSTLAHAIAEASDDVTLHDALRHHFRVVTQAPEANPRPTLVAAESAARSGLGFRWRTAFSAPLATLHAEGQAWSAGRLELVTLGTLRLRARFMTAEKPRGGPSRLFLWLGASPVAEPAALLATAGATPQTLFQLETGWHGLPGPGSPPLATLETHAVPGASAAWATFPATLLRRHAITPAAWELSLTAYREAPLDFLASLAKDGVARPREGVLAEREIPAPLAFAARLDGRLDDLIVALHHDAQVVLGPRGAPLVGSVRASLVCAAAPTLRDPRELATPDATFTAVYQRLLRGAYLSTLLAAHATGATHVVLSLLGTAQGLPPAFVWEVLAATIEEVDQRVGVPLDLTLIAPTLARDVSAATLVSACRARRGLVLVFRDQGAGLEVFR